YASDLYGLGLTAIYLLTGRLPQELGVDRGTGELIWRQYAPSVSPGLAAVLDRAIRSHPSERYSSARQMLKDLPSAPKPAYPPTPSAANTLAVAPGGAYTKRVQVAPAGGFAGWKRSAAIAASLICGALIIGVVFAKPRQQQPTSQPEQPVARRRTEISPESEPTSVAPPTASTSQPTPDQPVLTRRIPSTPLVSPESEPTSVQPPTASTSQPTPTRTTVATPGVSPQSEAPSPSLSPDAQIPAPASTPEARIPTRGIVPVFPVGTPRSVVESTLGEPTKISQGAFGKTRAASYAEYIPGEVSLGYLFDRETGQIRQTEVAFAQSVDLEQIQTTADQMMQGRATDVIRQKLRRVYQRRSNYASFAVGDLKGEIQRDQSDRIYIGVWDANLH
ncbi:MAG TPA: serine/threonine protein kinase, partial [Cyanobacteria bacterium UBA11369]|nr:serine/threonine protein kinase [Cyanobacteria bacterium UBA11369]